MRWPSFSASYFLQVNCCGPPSQGGTWRTREAWECTAVDLWKSERRTRWWSRPTSLKFTVWKFQDFCITQILREINCGDFWSTKWAILTYLETLNFYFLWIFALFECWNWPKEQNSQVPKMAKMAVFALLEPPKLISRKISVIEKSWNFHTVSKFFS